VTGSGCPSALADDADVDPLAVVAAACAAVVVAAHPVAESGTRAPS
jgi:hypothetical protein